MTIWKAIDGATGLGAWVGHDSSERFPVYTRGNAGEVYPEVFTPLSFSVAAEAGERAMRTAILTSGLIRPSELDDLPLTTAVGSGVFGGYAYLNLSIQRLASARVPGGKATDADANFLGVGDPPPHEPLPGERNLRASLAGLRYVWQTVRTTELPELEADQRTVDAFLAQLPEVQTAGDDELRQAVDAMIPLFAKLFERHLIVSFAAGLTVAVLSSLCERHLDDGRFAVQLLAGLGEVDSAAPSAAMWELSRLVNADPTLGELFDAGVDGLDQRLRDEPAAAEFVTAFDRFLDRFGSRGPNEWDTAFDTWGTDPGLALTPIDLMRSADDDHDPRIQQRRLEAEAEQLAKSSIARAPRPVRGLFRKVLASARLHSRSRERTKTTVVRAIHGGRLASMELDRRLSARAGGQRGDLWFLVNEELDGYLADPASMAPTIAQRREQHARLAEREPPFFFSGAQPPLDTWARRGGQGQVLKPGEGLSGLPGCPGTARGRARVVNHPGDADHFEAGDVLVAPLTDPAWTPLFVPAQAVVVDVGAIMSHAVIVSRELGIPCVVSATDATKRIPDGALVEVDGSTGTVTVLDG